MTTSIPTVRTQEKDMTQRHLFTGNLTMEELKAVDPPGHGLSHYEIVENMVGYCQLRGWHLIGDPVAGGSKLYTSSPRQNYMCLGLLLSPEGIDKMEPGWSLPLALTHCYDSRVRTTLWHGAAAPDGVGVVLGQIPMATKSGNRSGKYPFLPRLDALFQDWLKVVKGEYDRRVYRLRKWRLTRKELMSVVSKAGTAGANPLDEKIPWSRLGKAIQSLVGDEFSFWDVLQQVSLAVRTGAGSSVVRQVDYFRRELENLEEP